MRLDKPEILASASALLLFLLAVGGYAFSAQIFEGPEYEWARLSTSIAFTALGLFVFIWQATDNFIGEKIKLIYKNIHELKIGGEKEERELAESTDLESVEKDVAQWAEERGRELVELREREAYRREFIGNISHELKTPIFNIQGYLLTLLDGALEDPEINTKYLKRAGKSVDRMIALVQDLELITKLESGAVALEMDDFDIVELTGDVIDQLEDKAKKRKIQLKLKRDIKQPIWVHADQSRIEQVVTNLLNNAVKYGNKDGGKVEIRFFDMHENILVEIGDDGLGIPESDIPRVFERFYRVDKSRARDAGGTGLGLAIVKHIIDAHAQTINVRSAEDVGSTFSFTLKKAQ